MLVLFINIGLTLTAWYELIFLLFPFVIPIAPDTREGKIAVTMLLALAISFIGLANLEKVKVHNKFISSLVFLSLLSIYIGPKFSIQVNSVDITNVWMWVYFARVLIFYLLFIVLSSIPITKKDIVQILNILSLSITLMAVYVIFQYLGFEQFFQVKDVKVIGTVTNPHIIGNLGQSTIVAPFLGLGVLIALYLKKFTRFILCAAAVYLCKSMMALGGLGAGLIIYFILKSRIYSIGWKFFVPVILIFVLGAGAVIFNFQKIKDSQIDNGRFVRWSIIIDNIKHQKINDRAYPYTGAGLGSFAVIHSKLNDGNGPKDMKWWSSHNAYIDILYCLGFLGLFLIFGAIWHTLKFSFPYLETSFNHDLIILFISIFGYFLSISLGTFILWLSPYDFIFVLTAAFLHNHNILKGEAK